MSEKELVAIVTGANKGIGKAIVERLSVKFEGSYLAQMTGARTLLIYLTARDEARGFAALASARASCPPSVTIQFAQVDIDSTDSIHIFSETMKNRHRTVDLLINNAGIMAEGPILNEHVVETTLRTNYYGTKEMCLAFLPLLNPTHGRIVNVSSFACHLLYPRLTSPTLPAQFRAALTIPAVDVLMSDFRSSVAQGTWREEGWCDVAYTVSKMGVTALTRALANETKGTEREAALINAVCPGYAKTDMTSNMDFDIAQKSAEEGAVTPVMLALDDIQGKSGTYWNDGGEYDW